MSDWKSVNHSKHLLQHHPILVCKHRKKLLAGNNISSDIKNLSTEICERRGVNMKYMETDKDRIHYMIETDPTVRLSDLVRALKSFTIYYFQRRCPATYPSASGRRGRSGPTDTPYVPSLTSAKQD